MKQYCLLIVLILSEASILKAQYQGANNSSMGVLGVATNQLFSVNINPANLGLLDSSQIGIHIKKMNFAGRSLETGLQVATPFKKINLGVGIYNFGNSFYNFGKISVALAKPLDNKQGIGISVDFFREFVYLNSDANAVNATIGYYYKINEKLQLGASIRQVFYRSDERLERIYSQISGLGSLGLSYRAMPSLTFTGELRSDEINTMGLGLGMQLQKDKMALLMGFSNQENLINVGLRLPIGPVHWTVAYAFRQQLGSSVQSSLIYLW
jgi:hypothetical protein